MSDDADTQRQIGDVVRLGTIESIDLAGATCRVRVGDLVTGDVPWLAMRAGKSASWSPPSIGEQGLLICAEGDTEAGVFLPGLSSNAAPAPSASGTLHLFRFEDGAELSYDHEAHALRVILPAGATAAIEAPGGVTITGDVHIDGKLTVSDDVIGGGKSLKSHKHLGVTAGGGISGAPQ